MQQDLSIPWRHPPVRAALLAACALTAFWFVTPAKDAQHQPASPPARAATSEAVGSMRERFLCRQADTCRRFGVARQDCATAGDIAACISIRMKGDDATYCTADGHLSYAASEMPNGIRCALFNAGL